MSDILHSPGCQFLRPDGIACTCGSFEREIAAAKLPRTATTTTEEPTMPDQPQQGQDYRPCDNDDHSWSCRCHVGQPVMADIPPAVGQSTRQKMTASTGSRGRAICEHAADLINGDRNASYGDAEQNFTETGKLWAVVLGLPEVTAEQVALCLNQLKVARLIHNPNHADSWTDGVGYLALGGGIASKPGRYV